VTPVIGVLALQRDAAEHLRALAAAGVQAVPVRRPGELNAVDGHRPSQWQDRQLPP